MVELWLCIPAKSFSMIVTVCSALDNCVGGPVDQIDAGNSLLAGISLEILKKKPGCNRI